LVVKVEDKMRGSKWAREVYETKKTGRNSRWEVRLEARRDNDMNDEEENVLWDDSRSLITKMNEIKAPVTLGSMSA
jgi:hypothetical protein